MDKLHRLILIGKMLVRLDLLTLVHAIWIRYHHLEFGQANFISPEHGNFHQYSGGPQLTKVLRSLSIPKGSVALDLGVGMGIAALTLSRYFSLVIGVDIALELLAAAKRNMVRMHVSNIELHCADVRDFTYGIDRVTHVYMFNPFPAAVMTSVMENLKKSLLRTPRPLIIIYKNPVCHEEIVAAGFTHKRDFYSSQRHPIWYKVAVYEA